jgi:putative salt-induced outer membrane protein YdiY
MLRLMGARVMAIAGVLWLGAGVCLAQPEAGVVAEPAAEGAPAPEPAWGWSAGLGLNGAEGNTERFAFRGTFEGERSASDMKTTLGLVYAYGRDDGNVSENRLHAEARNDWLFGESPWIIFAKGSYDFDDLQDWDSRFSGFAGPGYRFVNTAETTLVGRVGAGVTYDIGGAQSGDIVPEGLLGFDVTHQVTERQKVFATVEYFPSLDDFPAYRFTANAGYEILVDPELNMSLRAGVSDRYDSTPGEGFKRNDLDYFLLLIWSF